MLIPGLYRAENDDNIYDQYRIDIRVKETEKSYIFTLEDFDNRYNAIEIEILFSKSKKVTIKKGGGGHEILVWSDSYFTIYPLRAGIPYHFWRVKETT